MSTKQIQYAESLANQLIAIWTKLGGKYADWKEGKVHQILKDRKITYYLRQTWSGYSDAELQRAIGMLDRILAEYKRKWWRHCDEMARERQQRFDFEAALTTECLTWKEVKDWMERNAPSRKEVEFFTYAGKVGPITYWKRRSEPVRLYSEREAKTIYEAIIAKQPEFEGRFVGLFEPTAEPGYDGTLFIRRFVYTDKGETS